ncbi:MAG: LD-carboxypeptidase [Xanthomonadales bacterium]|nr:LD-carboxypeptidase [Xanthomonadales bacterium]
MSLPCIGAGRRIYLFSPSGALLDQARLTRGVDTLVALGFQVELDPALGTRFQRFAGTDLERLAALYRAAASGCELVMASRGGYGLTRLLPQIDWSRLRGPIWVGHSDCTALALAGLRHGLVSWNGPMLMHDFGTAPLEAGTLQHFTDVLDGRLDLAFDCTPDDPAEWQVEGRLWGGNLSVLLSLLGTPWWPGIADGLLWLEDVNETPYRIERMLLQLRDAGVLQQQRAILLGRFSDYRLSPLDDGYDLPVVFDYLRAQLPVPVLSGLPFGHVPYKATLPNGWQAQLQVCNGKARLSGRAC